MGEVSLAEGMVVLDLGCGGGIDCLIAAQQVGESGKVYGLDMTDEMLELARHNRNVAAAGNVEFVKGFIEDIPLPDGLADVVTSNCVINLSDDKQASLREACRVLKPGGTFMVADIIALKELFEGEAARPVARVFGCRAGVVTASTYRQMMEQAGFCDVDVRVFKTYDLGRMREKAHEKELEDALSGYTDTELDQGFGGAFVSGTKA